MVARKIIDRWTRWLLLAVAIGLLLWTLLMPTRALLAGRTWSAALMAPWLASNGFWTPGQMTGIAPGLGTGLDLTLRYPGMIARFVVSHLRSSLHAAAGYR